MIFLQQYHKYWFKRTNLLDKFENRLFNNKERRLVCYIQQLRQINTVTTNYTFT